MGKATPMRYTIRMLIYYQDIAPLSDFGIGIPVSDIRAPKCIEYLSGLPEIRPHLEALICKDHEERISRTDVARVHTPNYVKRIFEEERESTLIEAFELLDEKGNYNRYDPSKAKRPLKELFDTLLVKTAGTYQCAKSALESGFCFYFGGGFHHAHPDFGHGFCLINDIMITARRLMAERRVESVWVIDVDAHKGDGSAAIAHSDPSIRTLSIHMGAGWPLDGLEFGPDGTQHPSFIPSDIDIPVFEGEEHLYNQALAEGLEKLDAFMKPDLAIVVSGSDPYEKDTLPSSAKLQLTLEQMAERDRLVYDFLKERRIPAAYLMAGGYSPESWRVYAALLELALKDRLKS